MSDDKLTKTSRAEDLSEQAKGLSSTSEVENQNSADFLQTVDLSEADQQCFVLGYN